MRLLIALLGAALLLGTPESRAFAQTTPTASPPAANSQTDDLPDCPLGVVAVLPVGGAEPLGKHGRDFVAFLASSQKGGLASGMLWVNASGVPYRVPFTHLAVAEAPLRGSGTLAFRLPVEASLENAFVNSVDEPKVGPCAVSSWWTPQLTAQDKRLLKKLHELPLPELVDAQPIDNPQTACASRDVPARMVQAVTPQTIRGISGNVFVEVSLNADSGIVATKIVRSASVRLNQTALASANLTIYQTAISQCRPIASTSTFILTFDDTSDDTSSDLTPP